MKLVDDWGKLLRQAWSIRLSLISALLSSAEFVVPFVAPSQPSGRFAAAAAVISLSAALARIIAQPKMRK